MMTGPPDDLDACTSHAEAARWLLRCPLAALMRDQGAICHWLRVHHFPEAVDYLEAELTSLHQPRKDGGGAGSLISIEVARGRMHRIACGLPRLEGFTQPVNAANIGDCKIPIGGSE